MARKVTPRARKQPVRARDQVEAYDKAHPGQPATQAAVKLGLTVAQVRNARFRLRRVATGGPKGARKQQRAKSGGTPRLQIIQMILEVGVDEVREVLRFMTGQ